MNSFLIYSCLSICVALLAWGSWRCWVLRRSPVLTVSPATTVGDGALNPDGTFDFAALIHRLNSEGVTPENNAVVFLRKAFGSKNIPARFEERYYQLLGTIPPFANGAYAVIAEDWISQVTGDESTNPEAYRSEEEAISAACCRPWARDQFPRVSDWIDRSRAALSFIEQASRCSRFYSPLIAEDGWIIGKGLWATEVIVLRNAIQLLSARAMRSIQEGDLSAAWNDLYSGLRLSRLVGHHTMFIDSMVAMSMDGLVCACMQCFLRQNLTPAQARRCLEDYSSLAELTDLASTLDRSERFLTLQTCQVIWKTPHQVKDVRFPIIDINVMLRVCNQYYDRLVQVLKEPDPNVVQEAVDAIEAQLFERTQGQSFLSRYLMSMGLQSRHAVVQRFSEQALGYLRSGVGLIKRVDTHAKVRSQLTRIGIALASYRAESSIYPETLNSLTPKYLDATELNSVCGKTIQYRYSENEFSLAVEDGFMIAQPCVDGQCAKKATEFHVCHESRSSTGS